MGCMLSGSNLQWAVNLVAPIFNGLYVEWFQSSMGCMFSGCNLQLAVCLVVPIINGLYV